MVSFLLGKLKVSKIFFVVAFLTNHPIGGPVDGGANR